MCVFMYQGKITHSLLSFLLYKSEAKLQLGVHGGNHVDHVDRIITLEAGRAVGQPSMRFSCLLGNK